VADISEPIAPEVMAGAAAIIHCAAETAGGWEQHQKNSVCATEQVLDAAARANVKRLIHISSISVLAVPMRGDRLTDDGALEKKSRSGGPYAWGKIESERIAELRCKELGIDLRIVRPSALVDYRRFDPPGLLGKRIGNTFVAVGVPHHELGVADVVFSARTVAWIVRHFAQAPRVLNLFDPALPTKRELIARLRGTNPDLSVVWLPTFVLVPLSWLAIALQKILRPRMPAINIAKVFAPLKYDTSRISQLAPVIDADALRAQHDEQELMFTPVRESDVIQTFTSTARQLA
jgi:nucleoside-diphosphate-sugar epimerase